MPQYGKTLVVWLKLTSDWYQAPSTRYLSEFSSVLCNNRLLICWEKYPKQLLSNYVCVKAGSVWQTVNLSWWEFFFFQLSKEKLWLQSLDIGAVCATTANLFKRIYRENKRKSGSSRSYLSLTANKTNNKTFKSKAAEPKTSSSGWDTQTSSSSKNYEARRVFTLAHTDLCSVFRNKLMQPNRMKEIHDSPLPSGTLANILKIDNWMFLAKCCSNSCFCLQRNLN